MVEAPAAPGAPFAAARADDAEGGVRAGILGAPDGEGERAGYGRAGGDARSLVGGIDFEDGDVGAGVGAGERGGDVRAVGQGDGDLLLAADGMFGGDDDAGTPEDAAGRESRPGVYGHDIARRLRDGCRDFIGKRCQLVCHT